MNLVSPDTDCVAAPPPEGCEVEEGVADGRVQAQVRELLSTLPLIGSAAERRRSQRFAYPRLIMISPVANDGSALAVPPIVVSGKQLSEHGVGFYHPFPLPHRLVIASLERQDRRWLGFLLDLHWCRFTRFGWYESGGRFLEAVQSPLEQDPKVAVAVAGQVG